MVLWTKERGELFAAQNKNRVTGCIVNYICFYSDFLHISERCRRRSGQGKNWMYLSQEQYLEDFDYLYQQMVENYPYFGVVKRKRGIDLEYQYQMYREKIAACTNDVDFWQLLRDFGDKTNGIGHFGVWGIRYASQLKDLQDLVAEHPEYEKQLSPYLEKLDNELSKKNYAAMREYYSDVNLDDMDTPRTKSDNVTTEIIEPGKIAYIKIDELNQFLFDADKEILFSFYDKIMDYDNLIIDITENLGGSTDYYKKLVLEPLATEHLEVPTYLLIKGGDLNRHYLRLEEGLQEGIWQPISQMPKLENMVQDDLADMTYFQEDIYTVDPTGDGFKGHIWLLVSRTNYSAAEYAAMFSKESGFATLVGNRTGGDGIGVDPAYIILPNSGVVAQYSMIYGVTRDGRNSEEYGTTPDVKVKKGKDTLKTCLELIDKGE